MSVGTTAFSLRRLHRLGTSLARQAERALTALERADPEAPSTSIVQDLADMIQHEATWLDRPPADAGKPDTHA